MTAAVARTRSARPVDVERRGAVDVHYAARAVLGALLLEPETVAADLAGIGLDAADLGELGPVWTAVHRLLGRGEPVGLDTVFAELQARGELAAVGGASAIAPLTEELADVKGARFYAARLRGASLRRRCELLSHDLEGNPAALPELRVAVEELQHVEDGRERGIVACKLGAFLRLPVRRPVPLLAPWLNEQTVGMVAAPRGLGKTQFLTAVTWAVGSGAPLCGWGPPSPARCLYVDGELPASVLQARFATAGMALGGDAEAAAENIAVASYDLQERGAPNIATPEGQRRVEDALGGAKLLVLDSLSTLCRGGVENEAESWQPIQDWLLALRRAGVATLFAHHTGKLGQQRGTSKREDVLDVILSLKPVAEANAADGCRFELAFTKARSLAGAAAASVEMWLMTGEDGRPVWTMKALSRRLEEEVLELKGEGLSVSAIARELGRNKGTVSKIIRRTGGAS